MMINEEHLKVGKVQTWLSAASCQKCCLSTESGSVCGKTAVYRQKTIIYSPTSWSAPVPLSTTVSVRNSSICCSQMGFLLTTQMCLAYRYRSCVPQHLSERRQTARFQCEDRNTKLNQGKPSETNRKDVNHKHRSLAKYKGPPCPQEKYSLEPHWHDVTEKIGFLKISVRNQSTIELILLYIKKTPV